MHHILQKQQLNTSSQTAWTLAEGATLAFWCRRQSRRTSFAHPRLSRDCRPLRFDEVGSALAVGPLQSLRRSSPRGHASHLAMKTNQPARSLRTPVHPQNLQPTFQHHKAQRPPLDPLVRAPWTAAPMARALHGPVGAGAAQAPVPRAVPRRLTNDDLMDGMLTMMGGVDSECALPGGLCSPMTAPLLAWGRTSVLFRAAGNKLASYLHSFSRLPSFPPPQRLPPLRALTPARSPRAPFHAEAPIANVSFPCPTPRSHCTGYAGEWTTWEVTAPHAAAARGSPAAFTAAAGGGPELRLVDEAINLR
jgi:hypothetical protein